MESVPVDVLMLFGELTVTKPVIKTVMKVSVMILVNAQKAAITVCLLEMIVLLNVLKIALILNAHKLLVIVLVVLLLNKVCYVTNPVLKIVMIKNVMMQVNVIAVKKVSSGKMIVVHLVKVVKDFVNKLLENVTNVKPENGDQNVIKIVRKTVKVTNV